MWTVEPFVGFAKPFAKLLALVGVVKLCGQVCYLLFVKLCGSMLY